MPGKRACCRYWGANVCSADLGAQSPDSRDVEPAKKEKRVPNTTYQKVQHDSIASLGRRSIFDDPVLETLRKHFKAAQLKNARAGANGSPLIPRSRCE